MKTVFILVKRNVKLFFKDKGMFLTSLITPAILLVLYGTFLGNVFRDSFTSLFSDFVTPDPKLIEGLVGGEIISSILAVSCVTVSFCSNMLMVQDKVSGAINDFTASPVRPVVLSLSYYIANLISTMLICYTASGICFAYIAAVGWYMTFGDVLLILLDVTLLVLFGNALSSLINRFLNSQGQISAVGTVISSGYGFICGAYMPVSSFGVGLQRIISCLPGTYGTSLVRNHALRGVISEIENGGVPSEAISALENSLDCNIFFFGKSVPIAGMYAIIIASTALFLGGYILLNVLAGKRRKA